MSNMGRTCVLFNVLIFNFFVSVNSLNLEYGNESLEYTEEDQSESNEIAEDTYNGTDSRGEREDYKEKGGNNSGDGESDTPAEIFKDFCAGNESGQTPCRKKEALEKSTEDRSTTTLMNYPFAVSVQRKGAHYTTGALIDKRWVLSSAGDYYHVRESIKLFRARLGSVDCKRGGTLVPLKRVEIHPSYIIGEPNFDVALLRMAQPVDFTDFIRPIGLSKIETKVISAKFMTTYWPRLIVKGQVLPPTAQERIKQNSMRVSTQRLIPTEQCLKYMAKHGNASLDESALCLRPFVTHHTVCIPDAGAPLVAEDGLWGVTSGWTGPDCLRYTSPTLFTRISSASVRAWLDTQMLYAH